MSDLPLHESLETIPCILRQKGWDLYAPIASSGEVEGPILSVCNDTPYTLLPAMESGSTFQDLCQRITLDLQEDVSPSILPQEDHTSTLRVEQLIFREYGLELFYDQNARAAYTHIETSAVHDFLTRRLTDNFLLSPELSTEVYTAFHSLDLNLSVERDGVSCSIKPNELLKGGRLYTPLPLRDSFSPEDYKQKLQGIIEQQLDAFSIGKEEIKFHHFSFTFEGMHLYAEQSKQEVVIPYDNLLPDLRSLKYGKRKVSNPTPKDDGIVYRLFAERSAPPNSSM